MSMNISEQFNKMSMGEKIIAIAAPLFFIDTFLQWFKYDFDVYSVSRSGWSGDFSFLTMIAALASLVMLGQVVVTRFTSVQLPALPQGISWAKVHLGLGAYIALAVVIRLLLGESAGPFDADRSYGLFIAVVLAGALVAGGFLMFQSEQKGTAGGM